MKKYEIKLLFLLAFTLLNASCSVNPDKMENIAGEDNGRLSTGGLEKWEYTGPGGGGAMFSPSVSPHDPNLAFVSCDMTGSYITRDGGNSWRMFNLRGVVRFYAFDPKNPEVIYARSSALFKSQDGGETWEVIFPQPEQITGIISKGDHASERIITTNSTTSTVLALAIDPDRTDKLFAAVETGREKALFVSENGGVSWDKHMNLTDDVMNIFIKPATGTANNVLFIMGKQTVSVIDGNGIRHIRIPPGMGEINSYAAGYHPDKREFIMYAISGKSYFNPDGGKPEIYISRNGGDSWENIGQGLVSMAEVKGAQPEFRAIATCQSLPEVVYISYANLKVDKDTTYIGVAKSEDYGRTWQLVWKDNVGASGPSVDPAFVSGWLNERFGPGWGENPFAIGVAPGNPDICYTTDFGRTVKTADGGKKWEQVYTRKMINGGWASTGLQVTTNYMLAFDPYDSAHIMMANTDTGLLESHDGGKSWNSGTQNNGVPRIWVNSTYWITFDTDVHNRVWAVMSRNHDLPRPKMWRNGGVEDFMGGVLISENDGKTWQPVSEDIGEAACTHILIDPESDPESRILYVCAFGKGVYKSTDGGKTWNRKNQGIEGKSPFAWRIFRRQQDGRLYLVVSRRSEDGSIGGVYDGALYFSDDDADHWRRITLPDGTNGPTSLITDPENPRRLLLSAWGRPTKDPFFSDTGGGIFVSLNDGNTWDQVMKSDQHIHDLTVDPRNGTFYACGFNASAYRSDDRGTSWNRIKGFNFKWGKRVEPDPMDPEKIYIITFGGGVWHGPAKGDPDAREDIITPILSYDPMR